MVIIGYGGIKPVNRGWRGRESGGRGEALCQRSPVAPYSVLSCRVGSSGGCQSPGDPPGNPFDKAALN